MKAFVWAAALLLFSTAPSLAASPPATQCVATAVASGTPDAIRIPKLPCVATTTLLVLTASGGNTTTTPTISVNGATPQIIKRYTGDPVQPMDIPAAGTRVTLTNNGVNWFLLAPGLGIGANLFGPGAATSVGHPAAWNNTTGTLLGMPDQMQMTPTISVVSGDSPANSALWMNATLNGTIVGGGASQVASMMQLFEHETLTDTTANHGVATFSVDHTFGGGGSGEAGRLGIWANLKQVGASPRGTAQHHFHTGIFSNLVMNYNEGGTGLGDTIAQSYGFSAQVANGAGATNFYGITGGEIDIQLGNNSTYIKEGWGVAAVPLFTGGDAFHGFGYSDGIGVWAGGSCGPGALAGGSACAGFNIGYSIGRIDGYWPISDAGTIIKATGGISPSNKVKAQRGIDFSAVTFPGNDCAWASPGICIDGIGDIIIAKQSAGILFKDNFVFSPATNGAYQRIVSLASTPDVYAWQVNTAAGGDFSTGFTAWSVSADGVLHVPQPADFQHGLNIANGSYSGLGPPPPTGTYLLFSDFMDSNRLKLVGHLGPVMQFDEGGTAISFPSIQSSGGGLRPLCIDATSKQIFMGTVGGGAC